MIWNCDGKIELIEFEYASGLEEYRCGINSYNSYAWETGWRNAGPWDWYRKGYTEELVGWLEKR